MRRFAVVALLSCAAFAAPPGLDSTDPLVAVDLNRAAIIADIVTSFGDAGLRARLEALRADRLLAASLASTPATLQAILEESTMSARVARVQLKLGSANLVYTPLPPCRLIDTRGFGAPIQGGAFAPNERRAYVPAGACSIPGSNVASMLISFTTQNLTPASGGYLAILAPAAPVQATVDVFNLNSEWSASNTAVTTGPAGQFDVFVNTASAHVVVDVLGYFAPLVAGAVGTAQLADAAVTAAKLASNGCTNGQVLQFTGSAWTCATAAGPPGAKGDKGDKGDQGDAGPAGPNDITGNLTMVHSTATTGNILKGGALFIHNGGVPDNTFVGTSAGNLTTTGFSNTGIGASALSSNTSGILNTAVGVLALTANTSATGNTAVGAGALVSNTGAGGSSNTAVGSTSLQANTTGNQNVAVGAGALYANTTAMLNTGVGLGALHENSTGIQNVAMGSGALGFSTGDNNTALGYRAGFNLTTGTFNIAIGNVGVAGESNTIRIGTSPDQNRAFIAGIRGKTTGLADAIPVMIDSVGQLGTVSSSARVKDDIADMGAASAALMKLRPVTFHYKQQGTARLQYGLIAEEVAEVYPGLVAQRPDGSAETVMYQFLPPMLLNEVQRQQREIAELRSQVADLRRRLEVQ